MNNIRRFNAVHNFKKIVKILDDNGYVTNAKKYAVSKLVMNNLASTKITVTCKSIVQALLTYSLFIIRDIGVLVKPYGHKLKVIIVTPDAKTDVVSFIIKDTPAKLIPSNLDQEVISSGGYTCYLDTILKLLGLLATDNVKFPEEEDFNVRKENLVALGMHQEATSLPSYMFTDLDGVIVASKRQKKIDETCSGKKPHIRKGHFRNQKFRNKDGAVESRIIWIHHCMVHPELMVSNKLFTEDGGSCGN